jgi:diguanylate cyclase
VKRSRKATAGNGRSTPRSDASVRAPVSAPPLAIALEQSHEVKAKVEDLAENLAETNRDVEQKIAEGETTLSAHTTLEESLGHEAQVLEVAADLSGVTETLAQGIADLRLTVADLERTEAALLTAQTALSAAHVATRDAEHRALHDAATGLPNRTLFDDRAAHAIAMAERHGWSVAVMFIDLDKFKAINDSYGHPVGDATLGVVATRLASHTRDEDSVCRAGGDEFLYLLVDAGDDAQIARVATRIADCISQPFPSGAHTLRITASIGVAIYPRDGATIAALVAQADADMYRAKAQR